ncbi:MAG TPA: sulfurtransferase [Steroidobacteraceae bacterium]|nr:sulfurtransferase [Steroidobacteraceae bacterium]
MKFNSLVDVAALEALIGSAVILDCRFDLTSPDAGRQAYLREHIPTARYVDLNRDLSGPVTPSSGRHPLPPPERLAARLHELGVGPDTQVVAYDEMNGSIAARAWWLLRWLGHSPVAVLDGGLKGWIAAGGALESGEAPQIASASGASASSAPALLVSQPDPSAVVTTAELIRAREDPRRRLVDARAAERFAGTVEPLDPVAGHIPGAINHPYTANLHADGRFLAPAELRRRWLELLAGSTPAEVIAMCGSGVTACHNLLALELAGLAGAKLYAGSWSEWIRDPGRPVERGPAGRAAR